MNDGKKSSNGTTTWPAILSVVGIVIIVVAFLLSGRYDKTTEIVALAGIGVLSLPLNSFFGVYLCKECDE